TLAGTVMIDDEGGSVVWPPLPGRRRHAVGDATTRVITLDGLSTDWDGLSAIAEGGSEGAPQLRFLNLRTYMNASDFYVGMAVQSNANAPTANDDNYSVERGKSLGVNVPGVL